MNFGLFAINFSTCADPDVAVTVAQAAEAAGFESVWTGEHIVLPQRNPLVLAKELASVHVVSKGRLIVGVGAGYLEPEFAALGVPMAGRGPRMDEYITTMRAVWEMERPRHDGDHVSFADVDAHPRPVQKPSPPIVIGGGSWAAIRRAVTLGNGWYGFATDLALAAECIAAIRLTGDRYERPAELGPLEITVTPVGELGPETVEQYGALGVDRLVLLPQPDACADQRHAPVPLETILAHIALVGATIINR